MRPRASGKTGPGNSKQQSRLTEQVRDGEREPAQRCAESCPSGVAARSHDRRIRWACQPARVGGGDGEDNERGKKRHVGIGEGSGIVNGGGGRQAWQAASQENRPEVARGS